MPINAWFEFTLGEAFVLASFCVLIFGLYPFILRLSNEQELTGKLLSNIATIGPVCRIIYKSMIIWRAYYMFGFKTFKNKRYWILLPPFVIAMFLLYNFVPNKYGLILGLILVATFWSVYHIWNFYSDKKSNPDNE